MADFQASYANAKDNTLMQRVTMAIYKAAQNVASEQKGSMSDTKYGKRQQLAYKVKYQGESLVPQWALSLCSGGLITTASTDGDIEFTVNSQWDAFSGVTALDG